MDKSENPFLIMNDESLRQLLRIMSANIRKFDQEMVALAVCAIIEKSVSTKQTPDPKI